MPQLTALASRGLALQARDCATHSGRATEPPRAQREARPKAPTLRVSTLRQEAGRSIEKALLLPSKAKWEAALALALGEGVVLVASHTLAALHLAVFARRPLLPLLSAARTAQALAG